MNIELLKKLRGICILPLVIAVASCTSTDFVVSGTYPTPLVTPLPIQLSLNIEEAFAEYIYNEEDSNGNTVTIDLGQAQVTLFETVTNAMFDGTENEPQLIMTPIVDKFQYTIPRQTRAKIYEVWIKYRVTITEPEGLTIADWLVTGYGKTPTAMMQSQGAAIDAAANVALRDIGTQIAIGFERQPDIALWLASNVGG